jgi:hypothetical protein
MMVLVLLRFFYRHSTTVPLLLDNRDADALEVLLPTLSHHLVSSALLTLIDARFHGRDPRCSVKATGSYDQRSLDPYFYHGYGGASSFPR